MLPQGANSLLKELIPLRRVVEIKVVDLLPVEVYQFTLKLKTLHALIRLCIYEHNGLDTDSMRKKNVFAKKWDP